MGSTPVRITTSLLKILEEMRVDLEWFATEVFDFSYDDISKLIFYMGDDFYSVEAHTFFDASSLNCYYSGAFYSGSRIDDEEVYAKAWAYANFSKKDLEVVRFGADWEFEYDGIATDDSIDLVSSVTRDKYTDDEIGYLVNSFNKLGIENLGEVCIESARGTLSPSFYLTKDNYGTGRIKISTKQMDDGRLSLVVKVS